MSHPEPRPYVASRRIGQATVSVIRDGAFPWAPMIQAPEAEWRPLMPEANAAGELLIDMNVAHVRVGDASILIDLGFGDPTPDLLRRQPRFQPTPGVVLGLASLGTRPENVTHVVITHAHGDHYEAATVEGDGRRVPRYPNARYLLSRADWQGNPERDQPDSALAQHLGTLAELGRLDLVDGDDEIVPGVTLLHASGESPGHQIVRVRSEGQTFYYLGDLFHHPCEIAHLDWVSPGRDRAAAQASRERLIREAVPDLALLVFTHHPFPGWGRIVAADGGYRWEMA